MIRNHFISLILIMTLPTLAAPVKLVKDGQAQAVIVIPEKAIYPVRYAAKELQYHIEKSSGAKLPVYSETDRLPSGASVIYLGNTRAASKAGLNTETLAPAEYILKEINGSLYLLGKDRSLRNTAGNYWNGDWEGTLFAVYDLLEHELGIRWLWPGKLGEIIPAHRNIVLDKIDRRGKPFFASVRLSFRKEDPHNMIGWSSEKNRHAYYADQAVFLLRHRIRSNHYYDYGHAFGNYWKRFGNTHPEYFALLPDGKRRPLEGDSSGKYISMCVSQPAFWHQIVKDWCKNPRRNPDNIPFQPFVNACENDVPGMCVCNACRAWDAPDQKFHLSSYWSLKENGHSLNSRKRFVGLSQAEWGEHGVQSNQAEPPSLSDRYARFYLAVQKEARKIAPEAQIIGYAYANYRKPPKETILNDGIIIIYVPNIFFPYTEDSSKMYRRELIGWKKQGVTKFYYRPNYMLAGANMPLLFTRQIVEDVSFAAKNGTIATYFDSLGGAWGVQGPMLYALCRIQFDPRRDLQTILDEFYSGFGKASKEVKAYFDYWTERSNAVTPEDYRRYCVMEKDAAGNYGGTFKNFVRITPHLFPPESFTEGRRLLQAAEKAAAGDPSLTKRIAFLKKGLKDAELTVATRRAQKEMELAPTPSSKEKFKKAFHKMAAYRAAIEKDNICNYSHMAYWEKNGSSWPWKYIKLQ